MSRALYIVGAPGTGKSTLVDEIILQMGLSWEPDEKVWRELWVNPLSWDGRRVGLSLGVKRESFSGTDALSMSVQPRALEWLAQTTLPEYVIGEGMRLSSPKFLMVLDCYAPLTVVYLEASQSVLDERVAARGHDLNPRFRANGASRAANAVASLEDLGIPVARYSTNVASPASLATDIITNHWS